MDQEELAAILERDTNVRGRAPEAAQDQLTQLRLHLAHAQEAALLVLGLRREVVWVQRGKRAIGHALDHDRARGREPAPRLQRLGPRKHDVPRNEQLLEAALLGRRKDGA